jgi:3-phenylpropionate/trans-cinnamate dioxygenase ferredoxin subunit
VPFVRVASLAEVPEGGAVGVEMPGVKLVLARVDGQVYALADNCSHRDFPLSLGEFDAEACTITCEWHGAAFDLRTGAPTCPPATKPVPVFDTKVEGGEVWVDLG